MLKSENWLDAGKKQKESNEEKKTKDVPGWTTVTNRKGDKVSTNKEEKPAAATLIWSACCPRRCDSDSRQRCSLVSQKEGEKIFNDLCGSFLFTQSGQVAILTPRKHDSAGDKRQTIHVRVENPAGRFDMKESGSRTWETKTFEL